MNKHASLDVIFAQGSDSFRRANAALTGAVPARARKKAGANFALAPALQNPEPESKPGVALGEANEDESGGAAASFRRPNVNIALFRVQLLDRDNKWASVKFLLDGLCAAGLIPDDRECDINLSVTQTKVKTYAQEGTGVAITYSPETK